MRVPSARWVGAYRLALHALRFHKAGVDGSGKCDAAFTGEGDDVVEGVVFELDLSEIPALDQAEGLGYAYEKSGSLLRSIFIHAIFNAANVTLSLLQ